jgi:outer membrane protein
MSLALWRFVGTALLIVAPRIAAAADLPPQLPAANAAEPAAYTPAAPDWIVSIGIEGRIVPAWAGASETKFSVTGFPLFGIRKAGTPPDFFGPRDSFGFPVVDFGQLKLGPAVRLIWKRDASSYTELNGLGDVNYAIQAGGYADLWLMPWLRLHGEVRQGIGGEIGLTGDVFLDAVVPIDQWTLSGGTRVTMQTAKAVSPYFSVTAAQSASSVVSGLPALPVYNAGGGLYSYGAGTKVQYTFNPQWSTHAFVEYERLTGSAADSPLVIQRGSPNQFTFGLGTTYSFTMHQFW